MSADIIDTNIVEMKFDSRDFINNVNLTQMAVEDLKNSLNFDSNAFDSLKKAASDIDLSNIATNVESLSERFSTFGIVGMTAIQRITNEVMTLAGKLGGLLMKPWQQIITGGTNRAANIGKAKFQLEGIFGKDELGLAKLNMTMQATSDEILKLTNRTEDEIVAMNAADYAVADTAYGLDSAAKAASVLATSGVDVINFYDDLADSSGRARTEMQVALRGISGVAAMANRDYDDVARIFERVSGANRVMGDDLNSLAGFGLNATATIADYLNEVSGSAKYTQQSIREMVSKGEIDFMTFAKAMDNAYGEHAKDANNTFSGALSNMKFALSKIGADFIGPLRNKMVPLFNDVRMSINQVRKALNFKIHFPGLEEEVSIVELFTKAITGLSTRIHDFFNVWMGGQNVIEKAMSGFSQLTKADFGTVKKIFDDVKDGVTDDITGIQKLIDIAEVGVGGDLTEVFNKLGETFDVTAEEAKQMCLTGKISFEDFYNAVSSVYGNLVNDTRIEQIATVFRNILRGVMNVGNAIATFVGPAIKGFFDAFERNGINGVIDATEHFMNFTNTLKASADTQWAIYRMFKGISIVVQSVIRVVKKLIVSIFKIAKELSPLFRIAVEFAAVIIDIIARIADLVVESKALSSIVSVLVNVLSVAAYLIVNVVELIFAIAEPAIKAVGEVFAALARGIATIDISSINLIIDRFRTLITTISNGGLITSLRTFINLLFGSIEQFFMGVDMSFAYFCEMLSMVAQEISNLCDRIITIISDLKKNIINLFKSLYSFITNLDFKSVMLYVSQVVGFVAMVGLATTIASLGKGIRALSRVMNAEALLAFTTALKNMARAVLEFAVAMLLLSSIPVDAVPVVITLLNRLTLSLFILLGVYALMQIQLARINSNILGNKIVKFFNGIVKSLNSFLTTLGRSAIIVSAALALMALAGAVLMLFRSIKLYNDIPSDEFATGFGRVIQVLVVLTSCMLLLVAASAPINRVGNGSTALFLGSGNGGLMGAAVAMLALIIVLREFEKIIDEYSKLHISQAKLKRTLLNIANVMVILAGSVAIMGLTTKRAATGMIASSIAMLSFIIVLRVMKEIIKEYKDLMGTLQKDLADGRHWWDPLVLMAGVLISLTAAVAIMAKAVQGVNKTNFNFENSDIMAFKFGGNSQKSPLFSMVLMLLSLAVLMKTLESVVKGLNGQDTIGYAKTMAMLVIVLSGVVATVALMKSVSPKNMFGLAALLVTIGTMLSILSFFDIGKVLGAAIGLGVCLLAIAGSFKIINSIKIHAGIIVKWIIGLSAMWVVATQLQYFGNMDIDWHNVLAFGLGIGACLIGLAFAMNAMNYAKVYPETIGRMIFLFGAIGGLMFVLDKIPITDPWKLMALAGAATLLGMAMAVITRIISYAKMPTNAGPILATFGGIAAAIAIAMVSLAGAGHLAKGAGWEIVALTASSLLLIPLIIVFERLVYELGKIKTDKLWKGVGAVGALMFMLGALTMMIAGAGKIGQGSGGTILSISVSLDLLIPLLIVMERLVYELGKIKTDKLWKGVGAVGALMFMLGALTMMIAGATKIGNAGDTATLFEALAKSMGGLIGFIVMASIVSGLLGVLANGNEIARGVLGLAGIMAILGIFTILIAQAASIGDVGSTITLFTNLSNAMFSLMPLILAIGGLVALIGIVMAGTGGIGAIAALGGFVALSAILVMISQFTKSIASIANFGDVNKTLYLINTLGDAMMNMIPFIGILSVVSALLGTVAPMIIIGMMAINTVLTSVINFVSMLTVLGTIGDIGTVLPTLEVIIETMHELTALLVNTAIVGVIAIPVLPLTAFIYLSLLSILGIMTIISGLGVMSMSVFNGITALLTLTAGLISVSKSMLSVDISGLLKFVVVSAMMSLVNLSGLIKLSVAASTLLMASRSFDMIGNLSTGIAKGINASILMIQGLYATGKMLKDFIEIKTAGLVKSAKDILSTAVIIKSVGQWVALSLANGVLDPASLTAVAASGYIVARILEESIRNTMQIHSESPLYNEIGGWVDTSIGNGMTDSFTDLMGSGEDVMSMFGGNMTELAGDWGTVSGTNFVQSMGEVIWEGLSQMLQNYKDAYAYFIGDDAEAAQAAYNRAVEGTASKLDKKSDKDTHAGADWYAAYYNPENVAKRTSGSNSIFDMEDPFGMNNFVESMLSDLTDLTKLGDLSGASMDGLASSIGDVGSESGSTSKSLSELEDKISDLMEDYEDRFQTATERANKNLFKGVDDQGDDFLDKIKDIMKQYENIYTSAVEKTNSQNLFEEVKEEDENFAPETLMNNLEDQVNQINEFNTIVAGLSGRIMDQNLNAAIAGMDVGDLPQLRALYRMNATDLAKYEKLYKDKVAANQNKIQNELSGQLSQINGKYTNVATYIATDTSTQILERNLSAQISKLNEYNETVASLMGKIKDVHLREAIANMGIESLEELKIMDSMTADQLEHYANNYRILVDEEMVSISNELSGQLGSILGESVDIEEFYQAWKVKMAEAAAKVAEDQVTKDIGKAAGKQMSEGTKESIEENYNKDEAYQLGKDYVDNIAKGMCDPQVVTKLETTVDGIISMIKEPLQDAHVDYTAFGIDCIECIINGINSKLPPASEEFTRKIDEIPKTIVDQLTLNLIKYEECGSELMNQLALGIKDGVNSDESQFNLAVSTIGTAIVDALNSSDAANFSAVGKRIIDEIVRGMNEIIDSETDRIKGPVLRMMGIILGTLSIQGQYTDYYDCGKSIAEYIVKGLGDYDFESDVSVIVDRITQCFRDKNSRFESVGRFIISGFRSGIANNQSSLLATVSSLANKVTNAMKTALRIKSPSRVFAEIGKYVDEGFAKGLRDYSGLAEDASTDMATGSISAVQDAINQLSGMLDGSIDVNPVITPTLDLSEVNARSQALANMFNGRQIEVQARADQQQAEMMTQLGNILAEQNSEPRTITFNQTNNSPKALSPAEVYRNSKNAFSRLASAIT